MKRPFYLILFIICKNLNYTEDYLLGTIICTNLDNRIAIGNNFIEKYVPPMNNSFVYLGACETGNDSVLADAFLKKGAVAVVANSETVLTDYTQAMEREICLKMLEINSQTSQYYTLSEALEYAQQIYGRTDGSAWNAEVLIFGGSEAHEYRFGSSNDIYEGLVTDAYSKEIDYPSTIYDPQTGEDKDTNVTASYHIPKINLNSEEIVGINTEIYNSLYSIIQNSVSEITDYGYPSTSAGITYRWAVNSDILSLVVMDDSQPLNSGGIEYSVYNISVSVKKPSSLETVLKQAGVNKEEYYKRAGQALGSHFWSNWDRSNENFQNSSFVTFFNTALRNTILRKNIEEAYPYINESGQLCIVAKVYSLAAADYYWNGLNLVDFELISDYAEPAKEITNQINISEERAREIAYEYWNYTPGNIDDETGFELFVIYDGTMKNQESGKTYYSFRLQWWIDDENFPHMSTIDYVYIDAETGTCFHNI